MDDRIPRHSDFLGVEYSPLYMCKPKRGVKREESRDVYKLPHRLIEKKRRDRINECIGQLKDLLPEHLKLTTLGHLEKAVVLELTLKHLNALTAVTEQQHQKIIALQSGDRSVKPSVPTDLDAFHSGFQTCAKEVLQYLNRFESWTAREQRCTQLVNHLHKVSAQYLPSAQLLSHQLSASRSAATEQERNGHKLEAHANCVPVIQRTHNGELNENDTDTDSGYGGEVDKFEGKLDKECNGGKVQGPKSVNVKQESGEDPPAKRTKTDSAGIATVKHDPTNRPDVALLNSLIGFGGVPFGQQAPFCMPFYFINPSTAASYMPLIDKSCLEKYFQSAATSPFPLLYPGLSAQAAAAAGFPDVFSSDKICGPGVISQNTHCQSADLDDSKEEGSSTATENDLSLDTQNPDHESHETDNEGT